MIKRTLVASCMVLVLLLSSHNPGLAAGESKRSSSEPSAAAIIADILVLRPAGLIGTILGAAGFIISLPVTIPEKKVDSIGEDLVVTPLHFTFNRPLGTF